MTLALTSFHIALMVIAAVLLIAAAVSDVRFYRIPNAFCAILLLLFPVFVATAPRGIDWKQSAMIFALVGAAGFAMFLAHLAGAGDIKLLTVASLWAGAHFIGVLLVVTAVTGGLLSLFMVGIARRRQRASQDDKQAWGRVPIPYGVAIATGGLAVLSLMAQSILLPA